jgi:hypothetical protein
MINIKIVRKMKFRKIGQKKAISTIMANLTMLIIVMVLASILFIWATTSFGAYQGGAGYWFSSRSIANQERPTIENAFFTNTGCAGPCAKLYIRNVGAIPFTVASIYVNSSYSNINAPPINVTQVLPISVPVSITGGQWAHGDLQTITIATLRGTTITATWVS